MIKKFISIFDKRHKENIEKLKRCNRMLNEVQDKLTSLDVKTQQVVDELNSYKNRQNRIFQNKVNHGFNTTNIYQEARYIIEEVAELMHAIEKHDIPNLKEELSDIIIFAYGCASVAGVHDLDDAIFRKMEINEHRTYHKKEDGDFEKDTV